NIPTVTSDNDTPVDGQADTRSDLHSQNEYHPPCHAQFAGKAVGEHWKYQECRNCREDRGQPANAALEDSNGGNRYVEAVMVADGAVFRDIPADGRTEAELDQPEVRNDTPGKIPDAQRRLSELVADEPRDDEARDDVDHVAAPRKSDIAAHAVPPSDISLARSIGCRSCRFIGCGGAHNLGKDSASQRGTESLRYPVW